MNIFSDWQHIPEHLSPTFLETPWFSLHYYGLMYVVAFTIATIYILHQVKKQELPYSVETILDGIFWAIIGILVGGRLGYVLFYEPLYFLAHPLNIISPFDLSDGLRLVGIAGMSYHGGLTGGLLAGYLWCKKKKISFWTMIELVTPIVPLAYTFGRLGNFINGELYGRVTTVPWGMYFPLDTLHELRHPSQLYEAVFEGVILFLILWTMQNKPWAKGKMLGSYIIGYAAIRFCLEFFREPDPQLGFLISWLTMGQILSLVMVVVGSCILYKRYD